MATSSSRMPQLCVPQRRQVMLLASSLVLVSAFLIIMSLSYAPTMSENVEITSHPMVGDRAQSLAPFNSQCQTDPFTEPGLLVYGKHDSDVRWVPFTPEPPHAHTRSSDIQFDSPVPEHALDMACPQYMKMLANSSIESADMDWAKNRTVLFIGSSHDRNNVQNFCKEVNGTYASIGGHIAAMCNVTSHNLVLALWFMYGVVDSEDYDWYKPFESRPITPERRIVQVMLPWMTKNGINNPDLIIESSLFWDESFFNERSRHLNETAHVDAPLTYSELAWHRSRVYTLVTYTRLLYGKETPMMFRTRHMRKNNGWNRILRVFQLDQNLRAVAQSMGVKLFVWGDLLEGVTSFEDGDQHFPRGPVTWLFGDMMLFYLRQATTPGCWSCHNTYD